MADWNLHRRRLIALRTILGKEIHRFMRIWPQTVLPAATEQIQQRKG